MDLESFHVEGLEHLVFLLLLSANYHSIDCMKLATFYCDLHFGYSTKAGVSATPVQGSEDSALEQAYKPEELGIFEIHTELRALVYIGDLGAP